jgi:hypothetical protein
METMKEFQMIDKELQQEFIQLEGNLTVIILQQSLEQLHYLWEQKDTVSRQSC